MFRRFLNPHYFGGVLFDDDDGAGNGDQGEAQGNEGQQSGDEQGAERTFTQADIDRIVKDRVGKERQKFAGFDDLKAKAQKLDEIEQAEASEAEKAARRAEQAEAKVTAATERLRRANLMAALADEGVVGAKAKAATRLLDDVEFDDADEPTNLAEAITAAKDTYGDDLFKAPVARSAGDGDGGKGSGGALTTDEVKRMAREDPDRFNALYDEGKVPASALGGT